MITDKEIEQIKVAIHYSIGDYDDFFIIEGNNIEEIKKLAKQETDKRGLSEEKNELWSTVLPNK